MRVLVLHNRYRQYGGEDAVAAAEADLLRTRGVDVCFIETDNDADPRVDLAGALGLAFHSHWSKRWYEHVRQVCREFRPDVAHVHNFWMRLTPSVHAACHAAGVPSVQTLHNFRLFCLNAQFRRKGAACEDCLGRSPWRGVVRRCYHDSLLHSALVARMIATSRANGVWTRDVNAFIALSQHARRQFIAGGIPESKIHVRPNFAANAGSRRARPSSSESFVYLGRLSDEKGVGSLLEAWKRSGLDGRARLSIAGEGPERGVLEKHAAELGIHVEFAGRVERDRALSLVSNARALIMPSLYLECSPRAVLEAMSAGTPIIASRVRGLDETVHPDTGLQFEPGNAAELSAAMRRLYDDPDLADRCGHAARAAWLERYTPDRHFDDLMSVYELAIGRPMVHSHAAVAGVGA